MVTLLGLYHGEEIDQDALGHPGLSTTLQGKLFERTTDDANCSD